VDTIDCGKSVTLAKHRLASEPARRYAARPLVPGAFGHCLLRRGDGLKSSASAAAAARPFAAQGVGSGAPWGVPAAPFLGGLDFSFVPGLAFPSGRRGDPRTA
jgi:hypothetical protein